MDLSSVREELGQCSAEDLQSIAQAAIALARQLQTRAAELQTPAERRQQAELDRMVQHPQDKATLTQLTDQAFRSESAARAVDQLVHILDVQGIPRFFSRLDRTMLRGFQSFGEYLPGVAVPLVKEKMRHETANVILPAEENMLRRHLRERQDEGVRMNVNFLGEAIMGEGEAERRLQTYLAALQVPEIECLSVKISTLYSQISPLARSNTISTICDRLELLYRASLRNRYRRADETETPKFVYLDMEEYRDMTLTAAIFMRTLDRSGMEQVRAGIALQAYVPDSHLVQQQLTDWARQRVDQGRSPITIRIVKGANLEMERVEASLRGWPQAPFKHKVETDANYKRMVAYGLEPQHVGAVRLGIASHNLFEVAFAIILAAKRQALEYVQFEMLEGMANHQRRALHELVDNLLLYAPACKQSDFVHAIGYLVRRMDENTGPDNFLRHAFKIEVDSPEWQKLEAIFHDSVEKMEHITASPRRQQDRRKPALRPTAAENWRAFENEPDTDFALVYHSAWADEILGDWEPRCGSRATQIPLAIDGSDVVGEGPAMVSLDPSRPQTVVARYQRASQRQMERALHCAHIDADGWRDLAAGARYELLREAAQQIRLRRADLIGAALADAGKTILESDPEVSEAVDFVEFYALTALQLQQQFRSRPLGVSVVLSPWNFPIAIPCGGVSASLAAGNTVILKPASDTLLPARILCECFWAAGISRQSLQLVACSGEEANRFLLSDPALDAVLLTGGTETARSILRARPELHLLAETGGKNATIVTSLSDRDQAIKNVLHSAFSHAGQKCSATSLLLLEEEVYHDREFRDALADSAESLKVGSVWEPTTKMGPLIRPPAGELLRGLKELEEGESWLVMPRMLEDNPCLYSPGIKWDVARGSFTHCTELFGPVLGVMPFRDLSEAIEIVHQTGYGLTSGLESLDDREQQHWLKRLQAGNLYVNRSTTGAIVLRQPFGGMGKSAFGPGIKAGGPNYVVPLMQYSALDEFLLPGDRPVSTVDGPSLPHLRQLWHKLHQPHCPPREIVQEHLSSEQWQCLLALMRDYDRFAREEIRQSHDNVLVVGQDNFRRYLPMTHVRLRVCESDSWLDIFARAIAVVAVGGRATVSREADVHRYVIEVLENLTADWAGDLEFIEESDEALIAAIEAGQVDRLRYASTEAVPATVRVAAEKQFVYVAAVPPSPFGRIELLWYVREQSLSVDYHRYGNLGLRAGESRRPVQ